MFRFATAAGRFDGSTTVTQLNANLLTDGRGPVERGTLEDTKAVAACLDCDVLPAGGEHAASQDRIALDGPLVNCWREDARRRAP